MKSLIVTSEVFKRWSNVGIANIDNGKDASSYNTLLNYNVSMRDGVILKYDLIEEGTIMGNNEITFFCVADIWVKTGLAPDP